jgi:hypothetical protein
VETYADMGFDIAPHREALTAFALLGLKEESYRPTLKARDAITTRYAGNLFYIALGDGAEPSNTELLYDGETEGQAQVIRADVERYFLRHFPGRYCRDKDIGSGTRVYLVLNDAPA